MNKSKFHKLSFDVYPDLKSEIAYEYSSGVIQTYIAPGVFSDFTSAGEYLTPIIHEEGWKISKTIDAIELDKGTLGKKLREIENEKFLFEVTRVPIEIISYHDQCLISLNSIDPPSIIIDAVSRFDSQKMLFTLFSEDADQYANGVSPNGEEFLPIWHSALEAEKWRIAFQGYTTSKILAHQYHQKIRPELNRLSMLVAINASAECLLTVHPDAIFELNRSRFN